MNQKTNRKRTVVNLDRSKKDEAVFLDFLERKEVQDVIQANFVRCLLILGIRAGKRGL